MIIFPAIDLKNGNCVRLEQGDFNLITTFNTSPLDVALSYQKQGAKWLHVIDLDGAQTGKSLNKDIIKEIIQSTTLHVQVGGGIRTKEDIVSLLALGVTRVIVGTYALQNPLELQELLLQYPNQIIVSVDSKNGYVTYNGWQESSQKQTIQFCKELETLGVQTIVYTDIAKDGMMQGPNFNDYSLIQSQTNLNVIASGGVSTLEDVQLLSNMNLYGAIIGKALYLNKISLEEAIKCSQDESYPV